MAEQLSEVLKKYLDEMHAELARMDEAYAKCVTDRRARVAARDAEIRRLRSVLAQIIDLGDANDGPAAVMERLERAISLASIAYTATPALAPACAEGEGRACGAGETLTPESK